jgi:Predicted DNA binding protein
MRRLIVELQEKEFCKFEAEYGSQGINAKKIKTLEIIRFLRNDDREISFICKVEFRYTSLQIDDLFNYEGLTAQMLGREDDSYVYFIKGKPKNIQRKIELEALRGYEFAPFEIRAERVKMGLLGDEHQVRSFLEAFETAKIQYKVVLLTDAKFPPESPLNRLTEKQRRAIVSGYELGYFDCPRKISSEQLAKKLNLAKSTLTVHLRRAERHLLADMLNK